MSKPYLLLCLIPAFVVSGVALSYGIYDSTHPVQIFESDVIHCNDINTTLNATKDEFVFTSCNRYSVSSVEYAMTRDKNYIKTHCYDYDKKGECSKAIKGMTVDELRKKLNANQVF